MTADEDLVEQALAGSEPAFAALVDRYQQRLLRFLLVRCGVRADAEDALQDAFVDAWRYLHTFDRRWRFSTWLYRIALRRAARQRPAAEPEPAWSAAVQDPLADCMAADERDNLWLTARRCLSADACTALWLHYVEELPQRDVAKTMQRSLPWTKVTLMRARRRLEERLAAADPEGNEHEAYG